MIKTLDDAETVIEQMSHTAADIRAAITLLVPDNRMTHVQDMETLEQLGVTKIAALQYGLEARYNIDLDDEAAALWLTVGDVVRDVQNMLDAQTQYATGGVVTNVSRPLIGENVPTDTGERRFAILGEDGRNGPEAIMPTCGKPSAASIISAGAPTINRIEREDVLKFENRQTINHNYNALNEYQRIATKSAIYPGKGTPFGLMYAALGLAEAGEVQNKVKKAFRDDGIITFRTWSTDGNRATVEFHPITPERRAQIIKELGGALWYIAAVCDEIGATMSEVALQNLDELCGRGERDTLRGDGDNR